MSSGQPLPQVLSTIRWLTLYGRVGENPGNKVGLGAQGHGQDFSRGMNTQFSKSTFPPRLAWKSQIFSCALIKGEVTFYVWALLVSLNNKAAAMLESS